MCDSVSLALSRMWPAPSDGAPSFLEFKIRKKNKTQMADRDVPHLSQQLLTKKKNYNKHIFFCKCAMVKVSYIFFSDGKCRVLMAIKVVGS